MSQERWQSPLGGMRIVEIGTGISSGYAGKLFVDAGAEVIKVEPPDGDPLRSWSSTGPVPTGATGALFTFLAAGKASVVGVVDDPAIRSLLLGADVLIDDGRLDVDGLRGDEPRLVIASITPFGRTGPLAGRPGTDFIVQAECGSIAARGTLDRPPVQAGARIAEWAGGLYAAAAALAAALGVRNGADGAFIDASWVEAMTISTNLFADPLWSLMTALMGIEPSGPARTVETPSIYPTADGWIGFNTNGPQHAEAFLRLIERPDLIDAGYVMASARTANREEFDGWVREWTTQHTTAGILALAGPMKVPTVRVNDGATVLAEEQLVARGFYERSADGTCSVPRPHYRIDETRPPSARPVPALGADAPIDRKVPERPPVSKRRPLEGRKVLDVTCWWAGPSNTQILAAMGADVIHVESIAHADPMRYAAAVMFLDRDRWWELSSFYLGINTNKRGITLDLNSPDGVALLERLVEWADVVVENYTPRVMPKFGLGWDRIHAVNPRAVMVRQPAFGLDGPWADRVGFAQNMEQMAGMAYLTGHPDGEPLVPRGPGDPLGGAHAAFATLTALALQDRTGVGSLVEVPLIEGSLNITAEPVVEHSAYGRMLERDGNRSAHCAPQGLYACVGEEQWLAVSVADDEQWQALVGVLADPSLAADRALDSLAGRRAAHDRLDELLRVWASDRSLDDALEQLVAAGVPAARLADPRVVHAHPHFIARGFFEETPHPVVGSLPLPGMPFRMTGRGRWIDAPAPTMGQHNAEVLGGMLGLSDDEMARLTEAGVIGDRPVGS
ncbi:MAG: CoA transferase [Acidimicrobiia bacterium]|nr:CoA transferase [Acidimicrobiia bacterium]